MGVFALSIVAVTALVFIGLYFLFKRFSSGTAPSRNPLYWIVAFISTPVVYAGLIFIWFLVTTSYDMKSFDKDNWAENRESRYEYVDDLIQNETLIGLNKNELKNMLSEPDYEDDSTLSFYIGYSPKYFLNMDPDWLDINLTDGKAIDAQVRP